MHSTTAVAPPEISNVRASARPPADSAHAEADAVRRAPRPRVEPPAGPAPLFAAARIPRARGRQFRRARARRVPSRRARHRAAASQRPLDELADALFDRRTVWDLYMHLFPFLPGHSFFGRFFLQINNGQKEKRRTVSEFVEYICALVDGQDLLDRYLTEKLCSPRTVFCPLHLLLHLFLFLFLLSAVKTTGPCAIDLLARKWTTRRLACLRIDRSMAGITKATRKYSLLLLPLSGTSANLWLTS